MNKTPLGMIAKVSCSQRLLPMPCVGDARGLRLSQGKVVDPAVPAPAITPVELVAEARTSLLSPDVVFVVGDLLSEVQS